MKPKFSMPLRGIVPPLVTPLLDNDTLDVEGLERLIEHIISGGASALFLLGTTGEFASLSYKIREELVQLSCRFCGWPCTGAGRNFRFSVYRKLEPGAQGCTIRSRCRCDHTAVLFLVGTA